MQDDNWQQDTLAVRAGQIRTHEGEHSEPLFLTSSYVFNTAAEAAARFGGEQEGNVYSRYTNPTVRTFEERIAALEGGEAGVATASGMAAILSVGMSHLRSGDKVVCSQSVFGTTVNLFKNYFVKFGVDVEYVSPTDYAAWESAITEQTKLVFVETPSNPLGQIVDITMLASLAHKKDALLVVDNCFCTPALQKPLQLGADIVVHSATKFLDGQGRCVGGAVVASKALIAPVVNFLRTAGPTMSAFNAWVFLKGLETLRLRMEAHCSNALKLAQWLQKHPKVAHVYYPGLPEHPNHALAAKQQKGFGGVLSFEVEGGRDAAWSVIDATQIMSLTANLGDAKTTIVHPATTTHGRLTDDERTAAGIKPSLIRVAVGLEDPQDLIADLERGLANLV